MDRVSHCNKEEKKVWRKISEEGLDVVASELKKILEKPSVIILSGEVGAGKTTFTKKFVGTQGSVYSPSYSLINEVGDVAHADLYRIEDPEELIHLEMSLYLEGKKYFMIEWGFPFFSQLRKEVDERFDFFELHLDINHDTKDHSEETPSRNFTLYELREA
mgnify:CR=1 FL=1